jgi:hypothetical protein
MVIEIFETLMNMSPLGVNSEAWFVMASAFILYDNMKTIKELCYGEINIIQFRDL